MARYREVRRVLPSAVGSQLHAHTACCIAIRTLVIPRKLFARCKGLEDARMLSKSHVRYDIRYVAPNYLVLFSGVL